MTPRSSRQPQSARGVSMSLTSLWPMPADGKFSRSVQGYDEGQPGAIVSRTSGGPTPVRLPYTRRKLGASSCRPDGLGWPAVVSEEAGEQAPAPARRLISAGVDGAPDGWDADVDQRSERGDGQRFGGVQVRASQCREERVECPLERDEHGGGGANVGCDAVAKEVQRLRQVGEVR